MVTPSGVRISIWDGASIGLLTRPQLAQLAGIVDVFGRLSAKAQVLEECAGRLNA